MSCPHQYSPKFPTYFRDAHTVAAGVIDHVWTIEELFDNVMGLEQDRNAAERYERLRRKLFGN